jgi:glycerol-3-phosphate dehydrogenase (NAD(P)+)
VNEILARVVPPRMVQRLAFLSGPSFAAEVAKAQPTLVTIGANDDAVGARVQALMSSPMFRCYRTTDVAGIELGGALKNVLAIACG